MTGSPTWQLSAGAPAPLGATYTGDGANLALASAHAERVELCLFDATGTHEIARLDMPDRTGDVWHAFLPAAAPGLLYGYRVHGPYAPEAGHRFNASKLLVDPYARALSGRLLDHDANFGYRRGAPEQDLIPDRRDNAAFVPKCVLLGPDRDDGTGARPSTPWSQSILYELHVAGMTRRHPGVPEGLRGTLAGLGSEAIVGHLRALGITAVELLPVFPFANEPHLVDKGLTNYWGYNPYCFLALEPRYAAGPARAEFRAFVRRLHDAGIEVILDVVYNHTGEGWHLGPTLSLRGIDNATYYRLRPEAPRFYVDDTGCGNTLALDRPPVIDLVTASLRHWTEEMGVDGFRFDLATTLARTGAGFDPGAPLLAAIAADPALAGIKLIAEPWDVGPGGYRLGAFPDRFAEWNDRYRNAVRAYWRGDDCVLGELATRLSGSSDVFTGRALGPSTSLNYVTAHDGFTLRDLVSYRHKHNEANGEDNRDGSDANLSANYGIEGETADPAVRAVRAQQMRNMLATLLASQGVPMLLAGDEIGHSQGGNNNAYCQDNDASWIDWSRLDTAEGRSLLALTRTLIDLRRERPALRQQRFLEGRPAGPGTVPDAGWWSPEGREMTAADWQLPYARVVGMHIGAADAGQGHLLVLLNAHDGAVPFRLPPESHGPSWRVLVDTAAPVPHATGPVFAARGIYPLAGRSLVLLESPDRPKRSLDAGTDGERRAMPHAVESSTLALLCRRAGIETAYWDLSGRENVASRDTRRALLAAMGHDTSTERHALEALAALDLAPWRRLLPRAMVVRTNATYDAMGITIALPARSLSRRLRWQIDLEGGGAITGETAVGALAPRHGRHVDGEQVTMARMPLPRDLPIGTHLLSVETAGDRGEAKLIVAPSHCWRPDWLERGERRWGLACQLYGLRPQQASRDSSRDWGMGDLGMLGDLVGQVGRAGGAVMGINPLHALFHSEPTRVSPYSPSSRLFLNPLYIDITAVPELAQCASAQAFASTAPSPTDGLVDHPAVATAKLAALEQLFAAFETHHPSGSSSPRRAAFEAFVQARGEALETFALFQALEGRLGPPHTWPAGFAAPGNGEVVAFAAAHADRCRLHAYLQMEADRQLAAAATEASSTGMAVGLYGDLAVGAAPDGAEVWASPQLFARGARFGAPPDPFSETGQDWGMPPICPHALTASAYRPFGELLSANMCHAGALRLDHVMWLERMFWIPEGGTARDGTYVRYPREDLLGVLALESHRNRCLVIGEDLGTVPDGFRERMERETILSYRFVRFERHADGLFHRPQAYPALALATPASHDLATIGGFWRARDIEAMQRTGLLTEAAAIAATADRARDRAQLVAALADQQLLSPDFPLAADLAPDALALLVEAVHRYLARTPSALAMLNIEDLAGVIDQTNLPGTIDSYPNWRRRMPVDLTARALDDALRRTAAAMRAEGRCASGDDEPGCDPAEPVP